MGIKITGRDHNSIQTLNSLNLYFRTNISDGISQARMSSIKNQSNNDGLEQARRQVDEVQGIMKSNVDKVLEREGKLSQLEERADRLQEGTEQFHRSATRIKKKHFWENMKMKIIIGVVIAVIILIIIIVAAS